MSVIPQALMPFYNNVAGLRQFRGAISTGVQIPKFAHLAARLHLRTSKQGTPSNFINPVWLWILNSLYAKLGKTSATPAKHLDIEVADLLPQGVPVEAEQIRGANLIAACCR